MIKEGAMSRRILKIFLATLLVFLVLTPSFAFADDNDGKARINDYDPQEPRVPEMVEPCGENGIPVIYLTIDPDEFEEVWQSGEHTYRATGQIRITVPEGYTSEYGADLVPDTGDLDLEYIRGRFYLIVYSSFFSWTAQSVRYMLIRF